MTWIQTISPEQADDALLAKYQAVRKLYPKEYKQEVEAVQNPDGTYDGVTEAHSLIPDAMQHALSAFGVLMAPDLPLSRSQQEMIATVVSALNQCVY